VAVIAVSTPEPDRFQRGDRVAHDVHGIGVVRSCHGQYVSVDVVPSGKRISFGMTDEWNAIDVDDAPETAEDREFRQAQKWAEDVEFEAHRMRVRDAAKQKVALEGMPTHHWSTRSSAATSSTACRNPNRSSTAFSPGTPTRCWWAGARP
jgi:hypothetical protein